jgi:protein-S-isoprenylcysteine O-methyltransferase Ste14
MNNPSFRLAQSTVIHFAVGSLMALLWASFAYRHMLAFYHGDDWSYLLIGVSETVTAAFFLLRSAPATVSPDPQDWLFALAGTFAPLFFAPSDWALLPEAKHLVLIGTALHIFGMFSLNRSFALVAARREVKTGGMYKFVRHPLYASYLLIFTGYVLTNTTLANIVIYWLTAGFLYVRMVREEKHLALDPAYRAYMQQVRCRVIPFLF